jgi:hypothetical protein
MKRTIMRVRRQAYRNRSAIQTHIPSESRDWEMKDPFFSNVDMREARAKKAALVKYGQSAQHIFTSATPARSRTTVDKGVKKQFV